MAKILFVDDRLEEVVRQWELSGCVKDDHNMLPLWTKAYNTIEKIWRIVDTFKPDSSVFYVKKLFLIRKWIPAFAGMTKG